MVMALAFSTKYPDGVKNALNIFLFPDLSPLAGLESSLLTRKWDSILVGVTLTSFLHTSLLMGKQKVAPIASWDEAASHMEAWDIFYTVFLGNELRHPEMYVIFLLIEETSVISPQLQVQARHQPTFPAAFLLLIQQDFNESFCQALYRQHRVRWTDFESLWRALATGNFRPKLVALPGGIAPPQLSPHKRRHLDYWQQRFHPTQPSPHHHPCHSRTAYETNRRSRIRTPPHNYRLVRGSVYALQSTKW